MIKFNLQMFGGRGAGADSGSGADGPIPGGGRGRGNGMQGPPQRFQIPEENLKAGLGEKGKAASINEAIQRVNPLYGYESGNQSNYIENCQRCVVAYELQRRGYDVMALPTYDGDRLPSAMKWRGAFRHAKTKTISRSTRGAALKDMEKELLSYGNGARAIIGVTHGSGGHVFNAEVVGGKIRYVDAQTNTIYDPKRVLNHVDPRNVRVTRTDKLRISERAKKSVTKRVNGKTHPNATNRG